MAEDEGAWSDEQSLEYARYMETNVKHDHRPWARRIAADGPELPADATVVDVAGGPAFLLLELAPLLAPAGSAPGGAPAAGRRLVVTDSAPAMLELARERARERNVVIDTLLCPAEHLDLPDGSVDLAVSKHFVRLAKDLDLVLRELLRVLKPGGRLYLVDFDAEGPWLSKRLLELWIRLTAPPFLRRPFRPSMDRGLPASSLPPRLRAAGFADARVLHSGVSYLVRAERGSSPTPGAGASGGDAPAGRDRS